LSHHPLGSKSRCRQIVAANHGLQVVSVLLILKAFSAGCSALTGVERSQRRTLFSRARVKRAKRTEMMLGLISARCCWVGRPRPALAIGPRSNQTVPEPDHGDGGGTSLGVLRRVLDDHGRLALAANTSFGGLPILASLLARRQLSASRVRSAWRPAGFSIVVSGFSRSCRVGWLVAVGGNTNEMIRSSPSGLHWIHTLPNCLVVHWWRTRPARWPPPRRNQRWRRRGDRDRHDHLLDLEVRTGRVDRGHRRRPSCSSSYESIRITSRSHWNWVSARSPPSRRQENARDCPVSNMSNHSIRHFRSAVTSAPT